MGQAGARKEVHCNHNGIVCVIFSDPLGIRDSNEAETLAFMFALEFFIEARWVGKKGVIVECDPKIALAWVKKPNSWPWVWLH